MMPEAAVTTRIQQQPLVGQLPFHRWPRNLSCADVVDRGAAAVCSVTRTIGYDLNTVCRHHQSSLQGRSPLRRTARGVAPASAGSMTSAPSVRLYVPGPPTCAMACPLPPLNETNGGGTFSYFLQKNCCAS